MMEELKCKENLEMFKESLEMLNIKVSGEMEGQAGEIGFLMNQNKDIKKTMEGLKSPSQ